MFEHLHIPFIGRPKLTVSSLSVSAATASRPKVCNLVSAKIESVLRTQ